MLLKTSTRLIVLRQKYLFCETTIFNFSASQGAAENVGVFVILSWEVSGAAPYAKLYKCFTNSGGATGPTPTPVYQGSLSSGAGFEEIT